MSKYIDAEILYREVDRLMAHYATAEKEMEDDVELSIFYQGKRKMCSEIIDHITALQQEQPPRGYDEAYLNECIAKASKTWEGVDADKYLDEVRGRDQEQPDIDLEKEITRWLEEGELPDLNFDDYDDADIERTARHFYEFGMSTMRKRLTNHEYNREFIEKMKSEYPMDESNARKEE